MKPFLVYTALRLVLFVTTLVVVGGVVMLISRTSGAASVGPVSLFVIVAASAIISAIGSWKLLRRQREALAQIVEGRAVRATEALERSRSKEDID